MNEAQEAVARIQAYLGARATGLAHIPRIGPGVLASWPRTEDDADGDFELTAADLSIVLAEVDRLTARVAELAAEREQARQIARIFRGIAADQFDNPRSMLRQIGLDTRAPWLTADADSSGGE